MLCRPLCSDQRPFRARVTSTLTVGYAPQSRRYTHGYLPCPLRGHPPVVLINLPLWYVVLSPNITVCPSGTRSGCANKSTALVRVDYSPVTGGLPRPRKCVRCGARALKAPRLIAVGDAGGFATASPTVWCQIQMHPVRVPVGTSALSGRVPSQRATVGYAPQSRR